MKISSPLEMFLSLCLPCIPYFSNPGKCFEGKPATFLKQASTLHQNFVSQVIRRLCFILIFHLEAFNSEPWRPSQLQNSEYYISKRSFGASLVFILSLKSLPLLNYQDLAGFYSLLESCWVRPDTQSSYKHLDIRK